MTERLSCFKAYDIRGRVPGELNEEIAYRVGRALADELGAMTAVVGWDARLTSPAIADALAGGLQDAGVSVTDIGISGTEMVYFATAKYGFDAGVMVTASHNPPEYNGMKLVREGSKPISGDSGLWAIEERARNADFVRTGGGSRTSRDVVGDFAQHMLSVVPPDGLRPLKVLANAGNGCAGLAVRAIAPFLPLAITELNFEPDGTFPKGVPNPILEENRAETVEMMRNGGFDFGVAWDGDYDRCFFFDEQGNFIEGYYIVGLLAEDTLRNHLGATIIHDPRLTWNTLEIVSKYGGRAVQCKTGHAFIKERMRQEDAEYGGEMSAHHYFKAHWFCDSGIIPFLQIARLVSQSGRSLGDLVSEMQRRYPCSGEVNVSVADAMSALIRVEREFSDGEIDRTDGLSVEYENWRFNVRASNTEPVIRLNVESRGDAELVQMMKGRILELLTDG